MSDRPTEPKPGLYRHYKGGLYRLILVADHHEHDGRRVVVYRSLAKGTINARQVDRVDLNDREDCWNDSVQPLKTKLPEPRFQIVGDEVRRQPFADRVWLRVGGTPHELSIECVASDPGAVLFVRAESVPRDLDDALKQVEQARRDADAATRRVRTLEAELIRRGITV